ncbi:hypothetical protein DER46DRAFT_45115 [Fusarium sp. MPI-SDFR-AT-0072]|nr:hypothetical protein DER46DRAFT_45115 [Fusarium sp. MPI-SDFR-AT-0072]
MSTSVFPASSLYILVFSGNSRTMFTTGSSTKYIDTGYCHRIEDDVFWLLVANVDTTWLNPDASHFQLGMVVVGSSITDQYSSSTHYCSQTCAS